MARLGDWEREEKAASFADSALSRMSPEDVADAEKKRDPRAAYHCLDQVACKWAIQS